MELCFDHHLKDSYSSKIATLHLTASRKSEHIVKPGRRCTAATSMLDFLESFLRKF